MPYIIEGDRPYYDQVIKPVVERLSGNGLGDQNYVLSQIIWSLFDRNPGYVKGAELISTLEAVKLEFYRRKVAPYEDRKMKQNGDLRRL